MRIAQLANFVSPTSGGMRVVIEELGRGYAAAGHERLFVCPGRRDLTIEDEYGTTVYVRAPRVSGMYRMIVEPWRVTEVLKRFRPTSIEVSDKWTLPAVTGWARRSGVGSVLFSHERLSEMATMWLRRDGGVRRAVAALNRRLARRFDTIVVTSRYAAEEFSLIGVRPQLVPLGVDLDTFHPDAGAPEADGVLKLCYVGRVSHEKSPGLAVATAVELHRRGLPVRMDVYGTGPDVDEVRALAGEAPVRFRGFTRGRADVARAFATHDVSLSVCPSETFGLAVLEALASGTPVVAADRGGARELVDASSGEWGAPDAASLADAVERLWARPQAEVRAAARLRAEQYGWPGTVAQMLALHRRVGGAQRG